MNSKVWVLGDNKTGNTNQAIALAEELGFEYELKNLKYNVFGKLPNFLLTLSPIHIEKNFFQTFNYNDSPNLIISSGRRTAPLAIYLKKKFNRELKIVQIMRPNIDSKLFDLIILPQHDNMNHASANIVRIIGALSNIKNKLEIGRTELQQYYPEIKGFIAVIIGGNTKKNKFLDSDAKLLCDLLSKISLNHSTPFFISFSRRTPFKVKKIIKEYFSWPHIIYDFEENKPNPYFGMLANAEFIISTADSISMCSEVATTGKPLYIFFPKDFKLKKHRFFIQQLVDLGIARILEFSQPFLENYSYKPLYEVKKVANIIKSELLNADLN